MNNLDCDFEAAIGSNFLSYFRMAMAAQGLRSRIYDGAFGVTLIQLKAFIYEGLMTWGVQAS